MTGFGELGVTLAFVASIGALGQDLEVSGEWVRSVEYDAFTDEFESAHAMTLDVVFNGNDEVPGAVIVLGVGCDVDRELLVVLAGRSFNPSTMPTGDWRAFFDALWGPEVLTVAHSSAHLDLPVRFDFEKPTERRFAVRENALGLVGSSAQSFVRMLAERSRLRAKFPHVAGDIVADFALDGSRDALVAILRACEIEELANSLTAGDGLPRAESHPESPSRRAAEVQRAFGSVMAEAQEELAFAQARLRDKLLAEYSLAIRAAVERSWIRPPGTPAHLACVVRVSQAPSGDVVTVQIVESSGNRAFDSSVENAVWKSSPLPLPKDQSLFSRQLQFVFDPEG